VKPLPASLKRALADSFALGHPDIPWQLPENLPPVAEIRTGIDVLKTQLARVDRRHAAYCIAKLVSGFNEKLSREESALRLEVWIEACGDIPNDLWSAGTLHLLRSWKRDEHYGRAPEASDLRAAIEKELAKRQESLRRAVSMLEAAADKKPEPAQAEPVEHRLRGAIWRGWHARVNGGHFMAERLWGWAQKAERELAEIENRAPAPWADAVPLPPPPVAEKPRGMSKIGTAMQARLAELAHAHHHGIAPPPRPEHRDVPEVA